MERLKTCWECQTTKCRDEYYKSKYRKDGLEPRCKECDKAHKKNYYKLNKIKVLQKRREYRAAFPGKLSKSQGKRRKRLKLCTPSWVDTDKLDEIYKLAREREKSEGIKLHVDHIIPIFGENVCGLHVETNLQIITREENLRKGNTYNV